MSEALALQGISKTYGKGTSRALTVLDGAIPVSTPLTFQGGSGNDRFDASESNVAVNAVGQAGSDTLDGGKGNDVLEGGAADGAADVFVFDTGDGTDLITDFEIDIDTIDFSSTGLTFASLTITGSTNAVIDTGSDLITVNGVSAAQLDIDQFVFAILP